MTPAARRHPHRSVDQPDPELHGAGAQLRAARLAFGADVAAGSAGNRQEERHGLFTREREHAREVEAGMWPKGGGDAAARPQTVAEGHTVALRESAATEIDLRVLDRHGTQRKDGRAPVPVVVRRRERRAADHHPGKRRHHTHHYEFAHHEEPPPVGDHAVPTLRLLLGAEYHPDGWNETIATYATALGRTCGKDDGRRG